MKKRRRNPERKERSISRNGWTVARFTAPAAGGPSGWFERETDGRGGNFTIERGELVDYDGVFALPLAVARILRDSFRVRVPSSALTDSEGWKAETPEAKRADNPRRVKTSGEDRDAAYELELFIMNDADLHRQQLTPIRLNLLRKYAAGKYDGVKAPKLWEYLAESGAQKYVKEFGGGHWFNVFTPETRRYAARQMAGSFEQAMRAGEYDHLITEKGGVHAKRLAALRASQPKKNPARVVAKRGRASVKDAKGKTVAGYTSKRDGPGFKKVASSLNRKKNPDAFVIALYTDSGKRLTYHAQSNRFTDSQLPSLYRTQIAAKDRAELLIKRVPKIARYKITVEVAQPKEAGSVFGARPRTNPGGRKSNPAAREAQVEAAARLQADFSGHDPQNVTTVSVPDNKVFTPVGKLAGVLYDTTRDGKREKYIHKFRPQSRPLLAASHDGTELRIVGGRFRFTEAGIEDR